MRILYLMMIFFLLSCTGPSKGGEREKERTKSEARASNAQFTDLDGRAFDLDDFKGKPLVVNYWATWCVPCLKEFPSFVALQDSLKEDGVAFLFASPDKLDKIREFKKRKAYNLEFMHLNPSLDKLEIYALPSTFIYDSQGNLHERMDGALEWNTSEVIKMLKQVP